MLPRMRKPLARAIHCLTLLAAFWGCSKNKPIDGGADAAAMSQQTQGANPLSFLNGFEGEIGLALKGMSRARATGEVVPLSLQVKSDKARVDIPPGLAGSSQLNLKSYGILNAPEKKLYLVMDDQKQVIVIDLDRAAEQMRGIAPGAPTAREGARAPSKPPPKVTKTGATDRVIGYTCENWDVSDENRKMATLCVAEQVTPWFRLPTTGTPPDDAWAVELMDGKHFPLRVVTYAKEGTEEGRIEVTKLEKKAMAPSLFEIPAGYKVVDMGALLQQIPSMKRPGSAPGAAPALGQAPKKKK